ncbi:MAG: GntR family transcriptional regulator [Microbacteriaceae bacterium]
MLHTVAGNKAERSYVFIKEHITSGAFGPGYRLVLGQFAKELGVSVVPVREAIRRLEAEGLVTFTPNVGAEVVSTSQNEYRYTMETLSLVEGLATAMAAPQLKQSDLTLARSINRDMRDCLRDFEAARFTELNHAFHTVIFEHCANLHVLDLVHRGWARLSTIRESTFGNVPGRAYASVDEHDRLLELIEQRAPALEIELAARNHRLATMDAYLRAIRPEFAGSQMGG